MLERDTNVQSTVEIFDKDQIEMVPNVMRMSHIGQMKWKKKLIHINPNVPLLANDNIETIMKEQLEEQLHAL